MAEIAGAEFEAALFAGETPATGILAAVASDGTLKVLESWDPVQGDALHSAPAGSAGGGGTRRHLFDREVYVNSDGLGAYVNVRAWASITGKPTTVQGYGITNAVRTDLGATQNIDAAVTVAGAVTITTNAVYFTGRTAGAVSKRLIGVTVGGSVSIDVDAIGATFGAGVVVAGAITTGTDAANDIGSGSFRFRNASFSGTVTATTFTGALSGNATTATTLATTRTIWGQNFNGSANVTGALSGVTAIGTTGTTTYTGSAATSLQLIGATGTTTANQFLRLTNTGGDVLLGIESSVGATILTGATAYATVINANGVGGTGKEIDFGAGSILVGKITTTALLAGSDAAFDLGSGSFRWRDLYVARQIQIAGGGSYAVDVFATIGTVGVRVNSGTAGDIWYYGTGTVTGQCQFFNANISATTGVVGIIQNGSAVATADAGFAASVSSGTGGDPYVSYTISGVIEWRMGLDNSDSDKFKISSNGGLGSGSDVFVMTNAGALTLKNYGAGAATFDASGNITSVSDEAMKEDIRPYAAGLAALRKINPISYRFNEASGLDRENAYTGFAAQNLRDATPENVFVNAAGVLSMWDRGILAVVVNAVKEVAAIVDRTVSRVDALEAWAAEKGYTVPAFA